MRKTTNYKRYATGGAVTAEQGDIKQEYTAYRAEHPAHVATQTRSALLEQAEANQQENDASIAFQRQIDAQRNAEAMAHQQQHQRHRANQFLNENPDMLKHHADL